MSCHVKKGVFSVVIAALKFRYFGWT